MSNFAYQSLEDGQIVVSELPRPDLEELARWATVEVPKAEPVKPTEPATIPEGAPEKAWKTDQLKAFADREGIDISSGKNKDDYVDLITAALAEKAAAPAN